jgi:hypothetical protein
VTPKNLGPILLLMIAIPTGLTWVAYNSQVSSLVYYLELLLIEYSRANGSDMRREEVHLLLKQSTSHEMTSIPHLIYYQLIYYNLFITYTPSNTSIHL